MYTSVLKEHHPTHYPRVDETRKQGNRHLSMHISMPISRNSLIVASSIPLPLAIDLPSVDRHDTVVTSKKKKGPKPNRIITRLSSTPS